MFKPLVKPTGMQTPGFQNPMQDIVSPAQLRLPTTSQFELLLISPVVLAQEQEGHSHLGQDTEVLSRDH